MRVGIITYHRSLNFGAVLQAYALKTTIGRLGATCQIVDYKCQKFEKDVHVARFIKKLKQASGLSELLAFFMYGAYVRIKKAKFAAFLKKHLDLTRQFTASDIAMANNEFDIFITGSDQVWNDTCSGFDKTYFLDFVRDSHKKNSYAASFGFEEIPHHLEEEYKKLLSDYKNISVRERQGALIIKKLLGREVPVCLDPTLLLEKEDWLSIAVEHQHYKDYVLVYEMAHSSTLIDFVDFLSRKTGCQVLFISNAVKKKLPYATNIAGIGPQEFVGLFKNARHIVTNSFHGTCFSVIFNKSFFVELLPAPSRVNSRIENLLGTLSLRGQLLDTERKEREFSEIDYSAVNERLGSLRENSLNYLRNIVEPT